MDQATVKMLAELSNSKSAMIDSAARRMRGATKRFRSEWPNRRKKYATPLLERVFPAGNTCPKGRSPSAGSAEAALGVRVGAVADVSLGAASGDGSVTAGGCDNWGDAG